MTNVTSTATTTAKAVSAWAEAMTAALTITP
jgi:hypothetical protein